MTDSPFVSTDWLAAHLNDGDVVIIDGSWYLPNANRDPKAEYAAGHIPGAVFFDVDAYADVASGLPHMLLAPAEFAALAGRLGIRETDTIVVYDGMGLFSAPRVRWTFAVMGAGNVKLLEGGLPKWTTEGRPVESTAPSRAAAVFKTDFAPARVATLAEMRGYVEAGGRQVVDARPAPRFAGAAPEPRPGLRAGHMPGAKSAPFDTLTEGGVLKSAEALRAQFAAAGIDVAKPIVTTCGSGVTAATLKLALERAGASDVVVYDGAWAEWGGKADTPVVTGN